MEALDKLLKDIVSDYKIAYKQIFGGKIVVLSGDIRQILPVLIPRGTKSGIVHTSVNVHIFGIIRKLFLKINFNDM